jgi:glutathione S-transferase
VPADAELARETRARDRFFDLHVNVPMQKIVTDRLRPAGQNDALGVGQARAALATALDVLDRDIAARTWAIGDAFTMADCAAAPSLYYANEVMPFGGTHPAVAAYFGRLMARPSFARAVKEADPYRAVFPRQSG